MNNLLEGCYRSYYQICIYPTLTGKARISTCVNNAFKRENGLVIGSDLLGSWNSQKFLLQRKCLAKGDRKFCRGASCCPHPFGIDKAMMAAENIKNAVENKKSSLEYAPRVMLVVPSYACNNNCYFCPEAVINKQRMKYSLNEKLLQEIKQVIIPRAEWVIISGGEPFFSPQGKILIEWLISRFPEKNISVNTNGVLLREFGLRKIVQNKIRLNITLYGMSSGTYAQAAGKDNFHAVMENIKALLALNYDKMTVRFLICGRSVQDAEKFCDFVEKNPGINASILNNCYDGSKYWGLMRGLGQAFPQLKLSYRRTSALRIIYRKLFNLW